MPVAFRDSSSKTYNSGTLIGSDTLNFPALLEAGDLMILWSQCRISENTNLVQPAGWFPGQDGHVNTGTSQLSWYWKIANDADVAAGSMTITFTGSLHNHATGIVAYSGTRRIAPISMSYGVEKSTENRNTSSTTITIPQARSEKAGLVLLLGGGDSNNNTLVPTFTHGSYTERLDVAGGRDGIFCYEASIAADTLTTPGNVTCSQSVLWNAWAVCIVANEADAKAQIGGPTFDFITTGTALTVACPTRPDGTDLANGSTLLAFAMEEDGRTFDTPAGWTLWDSLVLNTTTRGDCVLYIYERKKEAGDTDWTWNVSSSTTGAGVIIYPCRGDVVDVAIQSGQTAPALTASSLMVLHVFMGNSVNNDSPAFGGGPTTEPTMARWPGDSWRVNYALTCVPTNSGASSTGSMTTGAGLTLSATIVLGRTAVTPTPVPEPVSTTAEVIRSQTGRRECVEFELIDGYGASLGFINPVADRPASIHVDVTRGVARSLDGLWIRHDEAQDIDVLKTMVRVWWVLANGDRFQMGDFAFTSAPQQLHGRGYDIVASLTDKSIDLQTGGGGVVSVEIGTNLSDAIAAAWARAGFTNVEVDPTGFTVDAPLAWSSDTTAQQQLHDLSVLAGFLDPYMRVDGAGISRAAPDLAVVAPDFYYGFRDEEIPMIRDTVVRDPGTLYAFNRWVAVGTSGTDQPVYAIYDLPDSIPWSFGQTGRHRSAPPTRVNGATDEGHLYEIARAASVSDRSAWDTLEYDTPVNPEVDAWNINAAIDLVWLETKYDITLAPGGPHRHYTRRALVA